MEIPDKLLVEIGKAVGIGNKKKINSLLGCRLQAEEVQSSFDSELLPSTDRASALLGIFVSSVQKDRSSNDIISTVECLQALLMVAPSFETPFEATYIFLRHAKKVDLTDLYLCVSSIQQFFQETMSAWSVKISPQSVEGTEVEGSRTWWRRFADATALMIYSHADDDNYDLIFQLFSGLLQSIFASTRSMDIQSFEAAVQAAFHSKRNGASIIQVLRLAIITLPFLRPIEIEKIQRSISNQLSSNTSRHLNGIPVTLQHCMELVASILQTSFVNETEEVQHEAISRWKEMILQAMIMASADSKVYADSTRMIVTGLQEMDVATMTLWCSAPIAGDVDNFFRFELASLSLLAAYSSDIDAVQVALDDSVDHDTLEQSPMIASSGDKVLAALFPESPMMNGIKLEEAKVQSELLPVLDGAKYVGEGLFQDKTGDPIEPILPIASILRNSITRIKDHDLSIKVEQPESSIGRRLLWVLDNLVERKEQTQCNRTALFCFASLSILYMEVTSSRTEVVLRIHKLLYDSTANAGSWTYRVGYALVNLIVRSLQKSHSLSKRTKTEVSNDFDPLLELINDSLPIHVFSHLVRLLAPTTSQARKRILDVSKLFLGSLYTSSCDSGLPQSRARAGMLGILELLQGPQGWWTLQYEAWRLLSNAIVFDAPHLSFSNRSWIYGQIADLLEHDEFDELAAYHFLRAMTVRASYYFTKDPKTGSTSFVLRRAFTPTPVPQSPHNLEERQTEDIVFLFRLQLSLLQYALSPPDRLSSGSRYAKENFARAREALLSTILTPTDGLVQMKELCNESASIEGVDDPWTLCLNTVMCQFSIMLAALLDGPNRVATATPKDESVDLELETMIKKIISQEQAALEDEDTPQVDPHPLWLEREGLPLSLFNGEPDFETNDVAKIQVSLLEFSIVLALTPKLPLYGHPYIDFLHRRVVQAVGELVEQKWSLCAGSKGRIRLGPETLQSTAAQFLSLSGRVIRNHALAGQCPPQEIESFIEPSLKYCKSLETLSQNDQFIPSKQCLLALWSLYQVLGGERAAIVFIGHLERNMSSQNSKELQHDHRLFTLQTVRTAADVDAAVQRVRLQIVTALKHCLLMLSVQSQVNSGFEPSSCQDSIESACHSSIEKSGQISPDFLLNVLAALSTDLRMGLNGESGGITPGLFLAYLAAMEECVVLLYANSDTLMSPAIMSFLMDAAKTLCAIMKVFPLEDATLFRSTFLIATATIPSMCREILRRTFVVENNGPWGPVDLAFCMDKILVFETLAECVSILLRWSALRNPNSMPWGDIVGDFHLQSPQSDQDGALSSDESTSFKPVPTVVHIQPEGAGTHQGEASKLRLQTKESWSWALSCSFLSLEEKWQECGRVMTNGEIGDSNIIPKCSGIAIEFYRERQEELLQSLRYLSKLFVSTNSEATGDQTSKHVVLEMIALNLPSAPRYRLCCLLLNVLRALVRAVELIEVNLRDTNTKKTDSINSIGCAEAICCLSAWLCISNMDATDVTVGICHWYSILTRRLPRETSSNGKQESKDEMERLSKLLALVGHLQVRVRKLQRVLKTTQLANSIADKLFTEGTSEMVPLIASKLSMIRKESKLEGGQSAFPEFPESSDDTQQKQKRAKTENKKRKRKSPIARSRNRVVDMFLSLDDDIAEDRKVNTDAFVDLEDFLVEG
ncbi:unnamed protein product [Cylindrotheca closterium]|uniref:Uncharacterized protein n=1 Tax=Cylindrotheca closterium TaxID=2856 RepID=A0AAD2JNF4_9STRA|nr:unnamed protein product [Cylindrotheca closterium]